MEQVRSLAGLLSSRAWQQRLPLSGTFELTPVCNLSCRMCYVHKTAAQVRESPRPMLTLAQWQEIGARALDAGSLYLLLTGGEPMLWPGFRQLYDFLHRRGAILSLNSNGTLFDEGWISWFRDQPPARINITLYGAGEESYGRLCGDPSAYGRVTANIDRLLDAGMHVKLNASMTPYNVEDMDGILAFARERKLMLEMGSYMFPPIRRDDSQVGGGDRFTPREAARCAMARQRLSLSKREYEAYLERILQGTTSPPGLDESCVDPVDGQVKCQAGRGAFWITWDGRMLPCGMVPRPDADVVRLGFAAAWQQVVAATDEVRLSGVCQQCADRQLCHACMAMAIAETGSHGGIPTYLCRMAQALREEAARELRMREKGGLRPDTSEKTRFEPQQGGGKAV